MEEMLEKERPDAVNLIVPAEAMADLGERILRKGIPLMLEKPPGTGGRQVRRLIRAAAMRHTPNMVAFNRRFLPLVARLRAQLSESPPGSLRYVRYELVRVQRTEPDFSDTAIHAVDTARFLAASPYRDVRISYQRLPAFGPGVSNIYLRGSFTSGALFAIDVCPVAGAVLERAEAHLDGISHVLQIPIWNEFDAPGKLQRLVNGRAELDISGADLAHGSEVFLTGGFFEETAAFFDAVRAGRLPEADLESALQSVEIMECIRRRRRRYRG
jgi:myo-inositol 2-dehydrogenase/D-chiro-inositol 1-dehydrogenase